MKYLSAYLLFLISLNLLFGQDPKTADCFSYDPYAQPVDMVVDVINLKGELKIEPYKQIVEGIATMSIRTLRPKIDSIIFHTPEIKIEKITINDDVIEFKVLENQTFAYPKNNLKLHGEYDIIINYTAYPTEGLYFTGWNDPSERMRKQIWAHSPAHWIPFINQKHDVLMSEFIVTFDSKYKVFSNGDRILERDNGDGTKTWHYRLDKPHVIYLICLVIGDYNYRTSYSSNGTPLELWYYPDQADRFETTYMFSEYMIDFLEEEIGVKYPWNLYRQAPLNNYLFGGMETTTATVFGDYMFIDERAWWMRNYINVNVHELVHQWFGNLVSHLNNKHVWLTESFATYYAKIFERDIFGEDYYQWERVKEYERTMNASKANSLPIAHSHAGIDRWYPKGSLVLDMLRNIMGDTLFRVAFNYYTVKHSYKVTETYDLLKDIRESTGMALDWFFNQWILRGGEPHIQFDWTYDEAKKTIKCTVKQIHVVNELVGYFRMPVNIEAYYRNGKHEYFDFWFDGESTVVEFLVREKPLYVAFDPERKVLKQLTSDRPYEEVHAQAVMGKNMITRYDAVLELDKFPYEQKSMTLQYVFAKDKFHLIRAEVLRQLAQSEKAYDDKDNIRILKDAVNNGDELTVRAVVNHWKKVPAQLEQEYRKILKNKCYINVELALENLSNSFPENDYLEETKNETGWRGRNIRITWLKIAIAKGFKEHTAELVDYTSESFDFETRINAFNALLALNYYDRNVIANLVSAYLDWQFKLSNAAKEVIEKFSQNEQFKRAFANYLDRREFTEKQKRALDRIK